MRDMLKLIWWVVSHRALQITSLYRGGDRGAAPPAQCAAQKIDEAARLATEPSDQRHTAREALSPVNRIDDPPE